MPLSEEEIKKLQDTVSDLTTKLTDAANSITKLEDNNKALLQEKADAKAAAEKAAADAARNNNDIEALENSWKQKLTDRENELTGQLAERDSVIASLTSGQTASNIASEIAMKGSEGLVQRLISDRLTTEFHEGKAITRVLDANGKPSALSVDDLKKEIMNDKSFAPLIVGSKANGSDNPGKPGNHSGKTMKRSTFEGLAPAAQSEYINKEGGTVVDD